MNAHQLIAHDSGVWSLAVGLVLLLVVGVPLSWLAGRIVTHPERRSTRHG